MHFMHFLLALVPDWLNAAGWDDRLPGRSSLAHDRINDAKSGNAGKQRNEVTI